MLKVLVVGSRVETLDSDPQRFQNACRKIGEALAKRGHAIVAGSSDTEAPEYWAMDGANEHCGKARIKGNVVPFSPRDASTPLSPEADDAASTARWPHLNFNDPLRPKGDWSVGGAVSLMNSDAIILVGGRKFTKDMGYLAIELERPIYAVAKVGGASQDIWDLCSAIHKSLGMPQAQREPDPADPNFGESVAGAIEFLCANAAARRSMDWKDLVRQLGWLALILFACFLFLRYVFHDLGGNKAQVILTTSAGAALGSLLSLVTLPFRSTAGTTAHPEFIRQLSVAVAIGFVYGMFALEIADFYSANITTLQPDKLEKLVQGMALVGIAVGALWDQALKRVWGMLGEKFH